MREIKLPFGRAADGNMMAIQSVVRGLACECACPACNGALVACKGEVVRPYFRHYVEPLICSNARETALHLFAKQLIVREQRLRLPFDLGDMRSARVETQLPFGVRPDVLVEYQTGETVAVEIWVSHQVDAAKAKIYAEHDQAALEIDLRPYRDVDQADWPLVILENADRWFVYPPLAVRLERERLRQEIIEQKRREREQAIEAMREAMRQRSFEENKLRAIKDADAIRAQTHEIDRALAAERTALAFAERQQELVKLAEERNRTAELRSALRAQRLREREPPDLQALVKAFGVYSAITPEAWARYDAETERYRASVRAGQFYLEDQEYALAAS
jgi:hypothetical protein